MFLTEEEALKRLEHPENICSSKEPSKDILEVEDGEKSEPVQEALVIDRYGKGSGVPIDPGFRAFLGIMAQKDSIKNVAEQFGSNAVTVGKAAQGLNSNGKPVPEGMLVKDIKERISDKVLDQILAGLDHTQGEHIMSIPKVKDRTAALKDLAQVHTAMAPKQATSVLARIVLMNPGVGDLSEFPSIEVEAQVVGA